MRPPWVRCSRLPPLKGYPTRGEAVPFEQPDGTQVDVVLWGDEYHTRAESLDGYTRVVDPSTKWICYAEVAENGELRSTGIPYGGVAAMDGQGTATELSRRKLVKGLRQHPERARQKIRATQQELWSASAQP